MIYYVRGGNGVLTTAEERAHFGLWAIVKSPLLIGTDLSKISSSSLAILKNAVSSSKFFGLVWFFVSVVKNYQI